jgi:hypothetical protein
MSDFRIETYRIFDVTNPSEYLALNAQNKSIYNLIVSMGTVNLLEGSMAQTLLWAMFPEQSVTGANLRNTANRFVLIPQDPDP